MIDPDDPFVVLVTKMRRAQREFFATRHPYTLQQSKRLELEVDKAIAAARQPNLFSCDSNDGEAT